jgi:hypothetical protein
MQQRGATLAPALGRKRAVRTCIYIDLCLYLNFTILKKQKLFIYFEFQ